MTLWERMRRYLETTEGWIDRGATALSGAGEPFMAVDVFEDEVPTVKGPPVSTKSEAPGVGVGDGGSWLVDAATGRVLALCRGTMLLGRHRDVDLPIVHPTVSSVHARLVPFGCRARVFDMGSLNGTRVNGVLVREEELADGDTLVLGEAPPMRWQAKVRSLPGQKAEPGRLSEDESRNEPPASGRGGER